MCFGRVWPDVNFLDLLQPRFRAEVLRDPTDLSQTWGYRRVHSKILDLAMLAGHGIPGAAGVQQWKF